MIRMIKGTYGLVKNGTVEPMTKHSPAFSINAAREAELVEAGVAVYEAEPESTSSEYNGLNMTELREAAAAYGVDASAVRSKNGSDRPDRGSQGQSRQPRKNRGGTFRGVSS